MALKVLSFAVVVLAPSALADTYCPGGNSNPADSNLGAVFLTGGSTTLLNNTVSDCAATGVLDFTNEEATLVVGEQYQLELVQYSCSPFAYPMRASAFIDWECAGDFPYDRPSFELMEIGAETRDSGSTAPQTVVFDFVVPPHAQPGCKTRLRVVNKELPTPTCGPCGAFNYGGAKDFSITIAN
jgi:hypothetical protein